MNRTHDPPAPTSRRPYAPPALAEYGRLEALTLGATGPLPDYLGNGLVIGPGCETFTGTLPGGGTVSRTSCGNVLVPPVGS